MLAHPTLEHLNTLGLYGLAKDLKELEHKPEARGLDHAEWLGLLLEYEQTLRRQKQFETRARVARLRHAASVEDVNYQSPRGLDRALFLKLSACDWIAERRNLLITGASGLGKSWLACALGQKACRENISVLYTRMPRLFADLAIAHGDVRYGRLLRSLARAKLLILDDQQFCTREGAQQPAIAHVAMGDGEVGEEPGHARVENRYVFPAGLLPKRAGEPALAQTRGPRDEQIAALGNPVAGAEFEKQGAVEPARALIIDVLDAGCMAQARDPRACFELLLPAQRQLVFEQ